MDAADPVRVAMTSPAWPRMCEIIRTVVVFPLVPVTDTIGMRAGAPGG